MLLNHKASMQHSLKHVTLHIIYNLT